MTNNEVKQIFDASFFDISKKLVRLEILRLDKIEDEEPDFFEHNQGYREKIATRGAVNATIICRFTEPLLRYVIETMHGGTLPAEDEIPLYVNEYINIICGHAISKINNITKTKSRLTVPEFYKDGDELELPAAEGKEQHLVYDSPYGELGVCLFID